MATATFAAGCFWSVEAAVRLIPGVTATEVGFMGGHVANPTFRQVGSGATGHAEVVRVEYDPASLTYTELLSSFWRFHDPTQRDRQGPDVGTAFRSVIFVHDEAQAHEARISKRALEDSGRHSAPIVTDIVPAGEFWRAEEHHQQYLEKRGLALACGG
ncbi:MAG: peptide-methionine (S)-S-oxide reductase MsrA [Alphaproteobacteria bacterium]|nr:peptide-methionine (S)-S-oxide reductase MsrA [Alphaproteobacteria bacterium]